MQRLTLTPRDNWLEKIAALGIDLAANPGSPYWREDAAYRFSEAEIETLEAAGHELLSLILAATGHVIENHRFAELGIPPDLSREAARSWRASERSLYGRFDLRFDGSSPPKLLEYNADTPTALFEASVVQWHWLEERFPSLDQYNAIHEALIDRWREARQSGRLTRVHFACMPDDDDDLLTTAYLMDTAIQAGLDTRLMELPEIGWNGTHFVDLEESRIEALFKLYPWDWLAEEHFFPHIAALMQKRATSAMPHALPANAPAASATVSPFASERTTAGMNRTLAAPFTVIEPAWRVIPASKGILPILWELFPDHPNLLAAAFDASTIRGPRILKPLLGREGANIVVEDASRAQPTQSTEPPTRQGEVTAARTDLFPQPSKSDGNAESLATDGPYAGMPTIAQAFAPLPEFNGWRPVIGLWTVGGAPAGMGIREDRSAITGRGARFVPHIIADEDCEL